MNRQHLLIGLTTFVLLTACTPQTRKDINTYKDFPQTVELRAETVPIDTALFRYAFRIRTQGDTVVVMDLHGADHFFHAFLGEGLDYLSSFGKRGEAPTEVISAENIRLYPDGWWTLDSGKGKLSRLNASNRWTQPVEEVTLDEKDILRPLDFTRDEKGRFLIPDYSGEARFCLADDEGQLLQRLGTIPTTNEEALQNARPALAQAWRSFIDYNPANGLLVAATQLGEVLEIYNLRDSTHIVCMGPNGEPQFQVSQGYGIPTGIMGFGDVQVTDRAIYAVFSGRTFKELMQSAQQGKDLPDGGRYLYVFSLQGKPLLRYTLDRHISGFHVEEEKGVIWATDVNQDQPVCRFRIKGGVGGL